MTRKKDSNVHILVSQEHEAQAQQLLERYHQFADGLHASTSREQAESALSEINTMPEATQLALLKTLSKEGNSDAADLLNALHELSTYKSVRKEARRALMRLEAVKIYPGWQPPAAAPLALQPTTHAPRFWKGVVTEARDQGEVELVLGWEQGIDYSEVRTLVFLLDYWQAGVKDCLTWVGTKRRAEAQIAEMSTKSKDIHLTDCTLAEGRRLIQEALSVNKWRGTAPHKEYRHLLPTINQFILEVTDVGEDRGRTFIDPKLDAEEFVANFIGGWSLGDYGLVYDMLSSNSDIREGLPRDEWIERRRAWATEADPTDLRLVFVYEREPQQSTLWLPTPSFGSSTATRQEVEAGWSLALNTTPLSGTLKEKPMGTAVNKETRRHWFWTSYTLVREGDPWRIQKFTDEGARAQGLSIEELQERIEAVEKDVEDIVKQPRQTGQALLDNLEDVIYYTTQAMHYSDALIVKLPLDRSIYVTAVEQAQGIEASERAAVYLERMAHRFAEMRGGTLRELGMAWSSLGEDYAKNDKKEGSKHFAQLAEKAFRDSIDVDNATLGYVLLAELLIRQQSDIEEAEQLLQKAQVLMPTRAEQTLIEICFGGIAMVRKQPELALSHYLQAAEISPDYPSVWYIIGHLQQTLKQYENAEESLKRAITADDDLRAYAELASVYLLRQQLSKAHQILEQGIHIHPKSAHLRALLSSVLFEMGEHRRAQTLLEEAERLNPKSEMVKVVRQAIKKSKKR